MIRPVCGELWYVVKTSTHLHPRHLNSYSRCLLYCRRVAQQYSSTDCISADTVFRPAPFLADDLRGERGVDAILQTIQRSDTGLDMEIPRP